MLRRISFFKYFGFKQWNRFDIICMVAGHRFKFHEHLESGSQSNSHYYLFFDGYGRKWHHQFACCHDNHNGKSLARGTNGQRDSPADVYGGYRNHNDYSPYGSRNDL